MSEADFAQLEHVTNVLMFCSALIGFCVGVAVIRFMDWYRSPECR